MAPPGQDPIDRGHVAPPLPYRHAGDHRHARSPSRRCPAAEERRARSGTRARRPIAAEALDQPDGRRRGAAGGEHVVDDQHPLAGRGCASRWISSRSVPYSSSYSSRSISHGSLPGLAHRDEAGAEPVGDRRGEDEAPGLDADHLVDRRRRRSGRPSASIDDREGVGVAEQRRDVPEDDAGFGIVGDVADVLVEPASRRPSSLEATARPSLRGLARSGELSAASSCAAAAGAPSARPVVELTAAAVAGGRRAGVATPVAAAVRRRRPAEPRAATGRRAERRAAPWRSPAWPRAPCTAARAPSSTASSGVATKIDEYEPMSRPTSRASANSSSGVAPRIRRRRPAATAPGARRRGRVQRAHQHLVHRQVDHVAVGRAARSRGPACVLVHLVEHDDGVVQREAEDREEGDDGRRRDLEPEQRVDADADQDVVDHGDDRRDGHSPLEARRDVQGDEHEEDRRGRASAFSVISSPHVGPIDVTLTSPMSTLAFSASV